MHQDQQRKHDAAIFWIEAAHRIGVSKTKRGLDNPKALDDAFRRLCGLNKATGPSQHVPLMFVRFLYAFEDDLAAFIDDYLDQELDAEGEQIAILLLDTWPGLPALIAELKAIDRDYIDSPQHRHMIDLIENWDVDASHEDNVAGHHLRMTTPKTRQ